MTLANLGNLSRLLRFGLGVLMLSWAIGGGPWWAYMGLYFVATGAWGYCPAVAVLQSESGA